MKQLPDTAHLHNDRAVPAKAKYRLLRLVASDSGGKPAGSDANSSAIVQEEDGLGVTILKHVGRDLAHRFENGANIVYVRV